MLRNVVDETQTFLANEELPNSECKTHSLVSAGQSCLATLKEVDEFLDKHSRLGNKTKRFIDTMRFITSDVQSLQSKLELNTQLLHLSFFMSIVVIKTNLDKITKEYQNGTREPSALSSVFQRPNSTVAVAAAETGDDELYDQLMNDLEGNDIHPDCIALHGGYIKAWLHDIATNGPPEEPWSNSAAPEPVLESPPTLQSKALHMIKRKPCFPNVPSTTVTDHSSEEVSYASSISTHIEELSLQAPADQPDSELVTQLLGALFLLDPFEQYIAEDTLPRLQRAFDRLDYTRRGALSRSEILKASHDALEYAGVNKDKETSMDLPSVLSTFDMALSGQYDETMFISFMHHLVQRCFEVRKEQLAEMLSENAMLARSFIRQPSDNSTGPKCISKRRRALPFGWSSRNVEYAHLFYNEITCHELEHVPDIPVDSFTQMATEAAWAVDLLETLQSEWLPCAPRANRGQFLDVFNVLRGAAVKYTIYEANGRPFALSDLDDFIYSCRIITKLNPRFLPMQVYDVIRELEYVRTWSYAGLGTIVGFAWYLRGKLESDAAAAKYFSVLNSTWRVSQAPVVSRLVRDNSTKWHSVVNATRSGRSFMKPLIHEHAISLARAETMEKTPRQIMLTEMNITGFKRPKSFIFKYYFGRAKISVDNPAKSRSIKLDRSVNIYSWSGILGVSVQKSSKMTVEFFLDTIERQSEQPFCSAIFSPVDYDLLAVTGRVVRQMDIPMSDGSIASMKLRCDFDYDLLHAMGLSIIDSLLTVTT
ncbi:hypothetical protein K4F52_007912 [Lecanicillium sp. MT-2017a]|nr:hypothetical protein K4F52_007912 [Lecanicillium sp. MT-2017a]